MKNILKVALILLVIGLGKKSLATDLRGRVVAFNRFTQSYVPVPNVRVDIWIFNGVQWVDWTYSVTGNDGMYYFLRMSPGVNFQISINGRYCFNSPLYLANTSILDIPQIVI